MVTRATRPRGATPDRAEDAELFRQRSRMRILIAAAGVPEEEGAHRAAPRGCTLTRQRQPTHVRHLFQVRASAALRSCGVCCPGQDTESALQHRRCAASVGERHRCPQDRPALVKCTRVDILRDERLADGDARS